MSSGRLIIPLAEPALTAQGLVAPGTTMTVYDTGTTNLSAMYQNAALSTPALNPQTANSAGRFEEQCTVFWLDATAAYDVLLNFPDGSSVQFDEIYVLGAGADTSGFAPINSPNFTGIPTAPTPGGSDNSTKIATTAWVNGQAYAPLASPALSGNPTAPTQSVNDNSTKIATDAFVYAALNLAASKGSSGYYTLPGTLGVILQWGQLSTSIGANAVTFPLAFPTAVYAVVITSASHATLPQTHDAAETVTTTGFSLWNASNAAAGFYWMAIGS